MCANIDQPYMCLHVYLGALYFSFLDLYIYLYLKSGSTSSPTLFFFKIILASKQYQEFTGANLKSCSMVKKENLGEKIRTSSHDGIISRHGSPLHTTTSELHLKYRTTITRTIRNRVEWKSDYYRFKETTSIQTGRRGTGVEWDGAKPMCGWIKTCEGYLKSKESQPHIRPPRPGF